ncbi:MAG: selenide, water dikinase SelD [Oscillospiraceae bacterium]|nr:selenide, water dikinase SelD [Oscillospiraceae bacterium]
MEKLPSLYEFSSGGGCGAKIAPGELKLILSQVAKSAADKNGKNRNNDDRLLVGFESSDDAAVYRFDDKNCLLSTTDFFPPMVSDAKTFGKIAAANALSDIYAMGGKPLYALNLVCFPHNADRRLLTEILTGGLEKCDEAGAMLAGGHSIYSNEIKYGLAVTGVASANKYYRNNTPRIGDALILTKPLGVGIITAADREKAASLEDMQSAVMSMERLNKYASEKLKAYDVGACTDITGFGLLGHLLEMTATKVSAEIYCDSLPYISAARKYIDGGYITGGGGRNRKHVGDKADISRIPEWTAELMFDPQTSGGLLVAVKNEEADKLLDEIRRDDPQADIIGRIIKKTDKDIVFD